MQMIDMNVPSMPARLKNLLLDATHIAGSCQPNKCLYFVEEKMTQSEYRQAVAFLNWIVAQRLTFGHGTIDFRFDEFTKNVAPVPQDVLSNHLHRLQNIAFDEKYWASDGKTDADLPRVGDAVTLQPYGPGKVIDVDEQGDLIVELLTSGSAYPNTASHVVWTKDETRSCYPKSGCIRKG